MSMTGLRSAGVCGGRWKWRVVGIIIIILIIIIDCKIVIMMGEAYSLSSLSSLSKAWLEKSSSIFSSPKEKHYSS